MSALSNRFWKHVDIRADDECWEWLASRWGDYGQIKVNGRMQKVHRVAWLILHGPIPVGQCVCRKCDNSICVNPSHLYLGTANDKNFRRDRRIAVWAKVKRAGPDECWEWQGSRLASGHGHLRYVDRYRTSHAVVWEITYEVCLLPGVCVLHRCDNPPCCNPAHLWLGTKTENAADRDAKGRTPRGEANKASKLKSTDIPEIRALVAEGRTQAEIGAAYGISRAVIYRIIKGQIWRHVPRRSTAWP